MPCARPSTWNVSKMHICNYPPKQLCGLWPFPGSHGTEGALEGHSSLTQGESGPDCPPHGARGYRPPRVPVSALGGGQCHTATPSWPQKCRHGARPWRRADEAVPAGPVCGIVSGVRLEPAEAMCPPLPTACDGPLRQHGLRPPLGGGSLFSLSQGSRSGDPPGEALKLFTIAVLGGQFFSFTAAYPDPGMISDTYGTLSISIC